MVEKEMLLEDGKIHKFKVVEDCENCPWLSVHLKNGKPYVECECQNDDDAPCNYDY